MTIVDDVARPRSGAARQPFVRLPLPALPLVAACALLGTCAAACGELTWEALSFFRVDEEGGPRVYAATRYENDQVLGVDLSAALGQPIDDPISAFEAFGYDTLALAIAADGESRWFSSKALIVPVDLGQHHVAAGTNFPEHAAEAGVEDGPYLFPKLTVPTRHDAPVSAGLGLLDYEVEVGYVPLSPLVEGTKPAFLGFIACNDFTDRETLLRRVNTADVASGDGFTTAKSFPGYLPVGNLFVIPRDYHAFEGTCSSAST